MIKLLILQAEMVQPLRFNQKIWIQIQSYEYWLDIFIVNYRYNFK